MINEEARQNVCSVTLRSQVKRKEEEMLKWGQ